MLKRLMVIALLALSLTVAGGALAAAFPQKSMAFHWETTDVYTVISAKQSGNVKMAPGAVKFYLLTGVSFAQTGGWFCPVTGSGFMHHNGKFYFSLTGDVPYQGAASFQFHGYLSPDGTGHGYRRGINDTLESWITADLTIVPANTLTIPGF